MKIAFKIVNQFWFMKLHAWMWLKLTQKTFISKEIKYWWWSVTYFSFVSLKMWQFLIFKKIFRRFFFCLQIVTCKLRCLTMNIFRKSPNFQEKTQKRQNWRAPVNNIGAKECQLKLSIYEDLGLRYVISVKTMSISKSNWSTILLFRLNSFLKAHLICRQIAVSI